MTEKPGNATAARATQGVATLALLKVNFDQGHDHIEMFMPFVRDSIAALSESTFAVEELRVSIKARHELNLPESVLATLLGRAVHRGDLRRELGRYIRLKTRPADSQISELRVQVEREHANVASALRLFAAAHAVELGTDEEALGLLLRFFEHFHVGLLIDESRGPLFRMNEVVSLPAFLSIPSPVSQPGRTM